MESKLNALLVIVTFIALSFIGVLMKFMLKLDFDVKVYFWYLIILCGFLMIFGRPIVLIALDLIRIPYREHEGDFPLPGDELPSKDQKSSAKG
jgi:hypothetical protein